MYDADGEPGGPYTLASPPRGQVFGYFRNGGRSVVWVTHSCSLSYRPLNTVCCEGY